MGCTGSAVRLCTVVVKHACGVCAVVSLLFLLLCKNIKLTALCGLEFGKCQHCGMSREHDRDPRRPTRVETERQRAERARRDARECSSSTSSPMLSQNGGDRAHVLSALTAESARHPICSYCTCEYGITARISELYAASDPQIRRPHPRGARQLCRVDACRPEPVLQ